MKIRCPNCGSPVIVKGNRWECGWCGNFGGIGSLHPSEQAKLLRPPAGENLEALERGVFAILEGMRELISFLCACKARENGDDGKTIHKVLDYKQRNGYHMCVGCGRCDDVCPEYISFSGCVNHLEEAMAEVTEK